MTQLDEFDLFVCGNPIPKGRPRVTRRGTYTPPRTAAWEQEIAIAFKAKYPGFEAWEGPIDIDLVFVREDRRRCDLDNLTKAVLDALNGLAWKDDTQIVNKSTCKWCAKDIDMPAGVGIFAARLVKPLWIAFGKERVAGIREVAGGAGLHGDGCGERESGETLPDAGGGAGGKGA